MHSAILHCHLVRDFSVWRLDFGSYELRQNGERIIRFSTSRETIAYFVEEFPEYTEEPISKAIWRIPSKGQLIHTIPGLPIWIFHSNNVIELYYENKSNLIAEFTTFQAAINYINQEFLSEPYSPTNDVFQDGMI